MIVEKAEKEFGKFSNDKSKLFFKSTHERFVVFKVPGTSTWKSTVEKTKGLPPRYFMYDLENVEEDALNFQSGCIWSKKGKFTQKDKEKMFSIILNKE